MEPSTVTDTVADTHKRVPSKGRTLIMKRLLPLFALAAGIAAFFGLGLDRYLSFEMLSENRQTLLQWKAENGAAAVIVFLGIYALAVAFSLPGATWLTLGGGFLFGTWLGTLWVVIGASVGAVAVFLIARYALGDFLERKAGPALLKMEHGFQEDAFNYLLVLRLVPIFPFWLVNLVPALLNVRLRTYALGTVIGIIPGSFVYTSVGSGLGAVFDAGGTPDLSILTKPEIILPLVGLSLLALVPVAYKKYQHRNKG